MEKFIIEYSEDNNKWQIAGTVPGEQNKTNYFFNHLLLSGETVYYRVKAYDNKGESYVSKEVIIRTQSKQQIKLQPNPADDEFSIYFGETDYSNDRMIYILNATGSKMYEHTFYSKFMTINTSSYPNGYYVINIIDKGVITSTKVLIRH